MTTILVIFGNPPADASGLTVCLPDGIAEIPVNLSVRGASGGWTADILSRSPDGGEMGNDHHSFLVDLRTAGR